MSEPTFGNELRRLREQRGLSLKKFAHLVHYDPGYLSKIENGLKPPTATLATACDAALDTGGMLAALVPTPAASKSSRVMRDGARLGEESWSRQSTAVIAFHPAPASSGSSDNTKYRELLGLLSMIGALVTTSGADYQLDPDRLAYYSNDVGRVDDVVVEEYAMLNTHLWRAFVLSRFKGAVLPLVRSQLDVLMASLSQSRGPVTHQRLCALTSELLQLAGEIFFDANRYTDAAYCYTLAATAGKEANAFDLWACALTRHAFIGMYERRFERAVPMLELAERLARRGDGSLSTRYWVAAVQAQAFAGLGELVACQRALDVAGQIHEVSGYVSNGGWLRFDGSRLAEECGACYVTLHCPDLAATALGDVAQQNLSARRRGSVLTDFAMIGLQQGDVDQLLTSADAALGMAEQTGSGFITRKLQGLQSHLAPLLGNSHVRQLNQRITALSEDSQCERLHGRYIDD